MVRRAGLVLGLSCALAGLPAKAGPLDPAPALVVSGSGPTAAVVTLREEIEVNYETATGSFTGSYGGVLIETVGGKRRGGVLWVAALDTVLVPEPVGHEPAIHLWPEDTMILPPGGYRFYLLADQDAEIRLPLRAGDTPLTVRTTRAVRQVFATERKEFEQGQTSVTMRAPVTVGKRAFLVLIGQHQGWLTEDLDLLLCLPKRGKPCNPKHDPHMPMQGAVDYGGIRRISFPREDVRPGARDVLLTAKITSTVKETVAYGYIEVDRL